MRLTKLLALAAMLGIWSAAAAQMFTFTYPNAYSLLNPFDSRIKYTNFAALVTAGDVEIARLAVPSIFQTSITLVFPAQPTTVTVAKVRTGFTQVGMTGTVRDLDGAWVATYTLPTPFTVPAGSTTTVVYIPLFGSLTATLAAPIVVSPPVVVPPPVVAPPPPPPPTVGESPDGSSIPPLAQIVNSIGEIWTKQGTHAFINGNDTGGSGFDQILYKCVPNASPRLCIMYAHQSGDGWWQWRGSWASIPGVP